MYIQTIDLVWELNDAEFKQLKTNRATIKLEAFNTTTTSTGILKKMGYLVTPLKEIRLNGKEDGLQKHPLLFIAHPPTYITHIHTHIQI